MTKKYLYLTCISLMILNCTVRSGENRSPSPASVVDEDIKEVISDLYASINYEQDQPPDLELMRSLFLEGAYLIPVNDSTFNKMNVDEFIDLYEGQIDSGIIKEATEYEIHSTGDQFENIAHVFSTYQTKVVTAEDTLGKRGINSIQLLKTGDEWKITSIIWFDENEEHAIPDVYLPKKNESGE